MEWLIGVLIFTVIVCGIGAARAILDSAKLRCLSCGEPLDEDYTLPQFCGADCYIDHHLKERR